MSLLIIMFCLDLFASGARDGLILLWDARISPNNAAAQIKPYNTIKSYNWHSPGNDCISGKNYY